MEPLWKSHAVVLVPDGSGIFKGETDQGLGGSRGIRRCRRSRRGGRGRCAGRRARSQSQAALKVRRIPRDFATRKTVASSGFPACERDL